MWYWCVLLAAIEKTGPVNGRVPVADLLLERIEFIDAG